MGLRRIKRTSIAESAYHAIRDSVVAGRFPTAVQLVEARLAEELGVSRGPVREALRRLRDEGLVVDGEYRGLYVRGFSVEDIVDIYNVRIGLESVAIRLTTRMQRPSEPLRTHIAEMTAAAERGNLALLTERELAFHQTLCDLSGNRHIATLFHSISAQVQMAVALDNAAFSDPVEVAREHEPLVAAIEVGDEEFAAQLLAEHIVSSIKGVFDRASGSDGAVARNRLLLEPSVKLG